MKKGETFVRVYGSGDAGITWMKDEQILIDTLLTLYRNFPVVPFERLKNPGNYPATMHEVPLDLILDKNQLLDYFVKKLELE